MSVNRSRFTQFVFVLAMVSLIVGFTGCDQIEQLLLPAPTPPDTEHPGEIIIGVDLALTGEYAEPYGLPMHRGFELAREELNHYGGPQITFIVEDDQSTVEGAVAAFNKLIHEHEVSIITGLAISTQGAQAFPIAQENGVLCFSTVSSAGGLSAIGDFIFRAGLTTDVLNPNGVRITQEKLGYQQVALIYDDADVYSTSSNAEMSKALTAAGIEILLTESFQTGDTDFSAQLTRIMEAHPEAIFISALSNEMTQIIAQGRELGIPASARYIVPDLSSAEIDIVGDAAEGTIAFTGWTAMADTPGNHAFAENYRAKYGIEPEPWAAQSYAGLYILVEAISQAGSTEATAVRDAMAHIMDFDTILGQFSFNADGDAVYDPSVLVVKNGELVLFE